MFVWKEKRNQMDELKKAMDLDSSWRGSNRRATSLIPLPYDKEAQREVVEARKVRYQQLLISMEGKQSTCCLKVISPKRKSRSALLTFRGKALGCIYGRKEMESQLIGQAAFNDFLDDLSNSDSIVDTYILPEELALASAALFHGEVFHQPADLTALQTFDFVFGHLVETELPGCIVVKHADATGVIAFIYMFGGRVVGVFTFADGWLTGSQFHNLDVFNQGAAVEVNASKLSANNVWQIYDLSFSLTGLTEIPACQRRPSQIDILIDNFQPC